MQNWMSTIQLFSAEETL